MAAEIPESLRELARTQAGVVTSRQALAAGLTRAALIWQLDSARWQQLQHGVYAVSSGPPRREAVLWAAVLRGGGGAMLSHQGAAELARLIDRPSVLEVRYFRTWSGRTACQGPAARCAWSAADVLNTGMLSTRDTG